MTNDGPRQTEERLRHHLDSNQVMRERLCLAVMPLVGPYTRERPRRPKGGPDGGRDIEAIREGRPSCGAQSGFVTAEEATRRPDGAHISASLSCP